MYINLSAIVLYLYIPDTTKLIIFLVDARVVRENIAILTQNSSNMHNNFRIKNFKSARIYQVTPCTLQYKFFREGEIDHLIEKYVENLHIISSYYDHANWCIVAEKVNVWTL